MIAEEDDNNIDFNKWADFWYYQIGCNIIPAITQKKSVIEKWSEWQVRPIPDEIFVEWKAQNRFKDGIAVIAGKVWRGVREGKYLVFIDLDNQKAIDEFCTREDGRKTTLQEMAKNLLIEQHADASDKAHVFFYSPESLPKKSSDVLETAAKQYKKEDIPLLELKSRAKHGIAFVTPSMHKNGHRYKIIGTADPVILNKDSALKMKYHINDICKRYGLHYLDNVDGSGDSSKVPMDSLYDEYTKVVKGSNRHGALLQFMDSVIKKNHKMMRFPPNMVKDFCWIKNQKMCNPPLDEKEFEKLWKQANEFIEQKLKEENVLEELHEPTTQKEEKESDEREQEYQELVQEFKKPDHNLEVVPIAELGLDYAGKPVCTAGTVIGISGLVPDWSMIRWECKACGYKNRSDKHEETKPPKKCRQCDSDGGYVEELDLTISPRINQQTILIQDKSESIACFLSGIQKDMWPVRPGQKVQALGIQRYRSIYNRKMNSREWIKYFKLLAIKPITGLDVSYTDQDVEYFRQLAQMPNYRFIEDILVPSFAPHIKGNMTDPKLVCIYTLASQGLERPFNACLLGPPARGKTECTYFTSKISHNGNLTEFIQTSTAGLITETRRDPISGAMIAVPGILGMYSTACFTDMNAAVQHPEGKKLLLSMNHALENKVATSGKAGGPQNFDARCAVLIDSNNYAADWYYNEPIRHNLQFVPASFLSRIDFGAIVPKNSTVQDYEDIADSNYESYAENENPIKLHEGDWTDPITGAPRMGFETLRKFFFYISQQLLPPLPKEDEEMRAYFRQNYVSVRQSDYQLLVDGRYNRTALLLARVRARLLLKDKADKEELTASISFVNTWKNIEVVIPKTGEKDGNFLVGAESKEELSFQEMVKQQQFEEAIKKAMRDDKEQDKGYFTLDDITYHLQFMPNSKWKEDSEIKREVDRRLNAGKLYEKKGAGKYTPI